MNATNFNNKHRYFIQFMLHNGMVSVSKAVSFYERISSGENRSSLTLLKTLIIEINREIKKHSFKIATSKCEITGETVFVWLNLKNDQLSRLHAGFTPVESEYFHAIMQEIVTSDDHSIGYPRAINISSTLTVNLSKENGQKVIHKWLAGGYFVKQEGNVYLGARTILEFATYLRTNTENCTCDLCSELVFVGHCCKSCFKNFHSSCMEQYFQNQNTCPSCKVDWDNVNRSQDDFNDHEGMDQRSDTQLS